MKQLILVDTCNILHRIPALRNRMGEGIDLLAGELLTTLRPLHDLEHWELHLVVDGRGSSLRQQFDGTRRSLSIVFSASHQSADTIIESWLMKLGPAWKVVVATEDRAVAHTALAHGADTLTAQQLLDWLDRVLHRFQLHQQQNLRKSSRDFGNRLEGLP